jgi:tRNA pseudouridine55 synthase
MNAGIHLVHKPPGPTSFSIVRSWIERAGKLKVCHGGTLDPFASGLLLILAGEATKLFDYLHDVPKVYEATVRWGVETDNGDPTGRVVSEGDPSSLTADQIEAAMATFLGWHEQVPPATSAKRIGGERAYEKAHRGETFELPAIKTYLRETVWMEHDLPRTSRVRVVVRGGFYVRALIRDLGRVLKCGAHIAALRRLSIAAYEDPGPDRAIEKSGRELLPWLHSRDLTDQEVGELRQDHSIDPGTIHWPEFVLPIDFPLPRRLVRAFHRKKLAFLLEPRDERLHPVRAFRGGL